MTKQRRTVIIQYRNEKGQITDRTHSVQYKQERAAKRRQWRSHSEAKRREKENQAIMRAAKIGFFAGLVIGSILGGIIF